jgi:hypothetical protein
MPQHVGEGSGVRLKPKSTTQELVSLLATHHFQKINPISAGTMDLKIENRGNDGLKKNQKPGIFKIVLFRTSK